MCLHMDTFIEQIHLVATFESVVQVRLFLLEVIYFCVIKGL